MLDKSHCKIAYDTDTERLEVSDYYDFSSSYPDAKERKRRSKSKKAQAEDGVEEASIPEEAGEWEDMRSRFTASYRSLLSALKAVKTAPACIEPVWHD